MKKGNDAALAGGLPAASNLAAQELERFSVTLLKPHTHAREEHLAGDEITLTADQITWLASLGVVSDSLEK